MNYRLILKMALLMLMASTALADGFGVTKVYHPYVEPMEQEIEWQLVHHSDETAANPQTYQQIGYGRAIGERWFGELYLVGEQPSGESLELEAYEAELRHQLTEQGEYWADWGLLFELEKEKGTDIWEAAAGILAEKEHGNWSTTVNLLVMNEWGGDIKDELESRLAVQTRFRYRQWLEPAIEFHSAEDTKAVGPVLLGNIPLANRRNIHWEAGAFAGLDSETPDHSFRAGIEYEF